jgi:hypothetical protein
MYMLLLTLANNLALLIPLNMLFQASFVRCLLAVIYILPFHTHGSPTGCISDLLTPLNHGKTSIHDPVLQPFVRLVRIKKGLAGARREEIVMIIIIYGLRYNLDEDYIKTEIWSPYNIITTVVRRHCKPEACNKGVYNRKRPSGVYNSNNDKRDRKLHSTICGNRLHTMYRRNSKSGVNILT